ncbi:hypothetical protein Fmac_032842 [Flemingia macrophylla]|uniref:Uncharacterized protein n=1 Tax=Flemingia macrophylla TaxID=520843 RepID=A0ABD1L634_9FABA
MAPNSKQFNARNDAIVIRGVHDVAIDTSVETRKLEGKLDAIVNLVTQLAANQKPASDAKVCRIHSSNDHHTSLTTNQKSVSVARVCGIRTSNDHHTSVCPSSQQSRVDEILRLTLQTPIADQHTSKDKALDREDGSKLLAQFSARNDAIVIRRVHDVATDTSAETRKLEGKLNALVNLVTQQAVNQKPASVARVCRIPSSNDNHTSQFSARNDVIVIRGVHDVGIDTTAETRKLERKVDAIMKLLTQLTANQKPATVARVCGICSSNDHLTSVCPSPQQYGVDERPKAHAANTYSRPPQQ